MRRLISFAFALASFSATALSADRHIAFERDNAVFVANLDGTNEKKIADGIFPAISPDGTRVAFNTVEKTRLDGKNAKLLVKHARTPSARAP